MTKMLRDETIRFLKKHNINLETSQDEQQLVDRGVIERLLDSADVNPGDTALDIGAGIGNITVPLAGSARRVYAVERNLKFLPALEERTASLDNVVIVHGDALTMTFPQFTKIASNLPYAICEALIQRLLTARFLKAALILPKSFATTLTAEPGEKSYSKLTLVANAFFGTDLIEDVDPEAYLPPPRTMTSMVALNPRGARDGGEDVLRRTLLQGDRKLKNALREAFIASSREFDGPKTKREAGSLISSMGLDRDVLEKRVARLSLGDLIEILERL
jgi:16S rRNA (adenine1518-N6/adenine1519-N6)-dimethyltransferase